MLILGTKSVSGNLILNYNSDGIVLLSKIIEYRMMQLLVYQQRKSFEILKGSCNILKCMDAYYEWWSYSGRGITFYQQQSAFL